MTLNDFPNCLTFINKDQTPIINVNTEEGNVILIDSKGLFKVIYTTKTSITASAIVNNNLVAGDCFGTLYVFTETSMMLLHRISLAMESIKAIKDIKEAKFARILTTHNVVYDVDIQNSKILMVTSPKCTSEEKVCDITKNGFIQQTLTGVLMGGIKNKR